MAKIKIISVLFILVFSIYSCSSKLVLKDEDRIKFLVEQQSETELDEYKVFKSPSYPEKIDKLITEWNPTLYLILAMPYEDTFSNEYLTEYYMKIIENAIGITNILILVNENELGSLQSLISNLKEKSLDKYISKEDPHEIRILPVDINSKWIRDFGPIFAFNNEGKFCILDAIYRDVRLSSKRSKDDELPIYIANYIYTAFNKDIKIVKPPFQLWGGDFQTDGLGNAFTSTETLIMNGGNKDIVNLIFQHYYGIKNIVYLEPLPGLTIKHIDMFFKVIDENTILIGEYTRVPYETSQEKIYLSYLQDEVNRILEQNYNTLRDRFPQKNILRMPMPPLAIRLKDDVKLVYYMNELVKRGYNERSIPNNLDGLERLIFTEYKRDYLINVVGYDKNELPLKIDEIELLFLDEIKRKFLNKESNSILFDLYLSYYTDKFLSSMMQSDMESILAETPDAYNYIYKTYLNSTYINGKNKNLLLVPSYIFENSEEYEEKVKDIYGKVYPNTTIIFINSDKIINQYGAIHCITSTIPLLN